MKLPTRKKVLIVIISSLTFVIAATAFVLLKHTTYTKVLEPAVEKSNDTRRERVYAVCNNSQTKNFIDGFDLTEYGTVERGGFEGSFQEKLLELNSEEDQGYAAFITTIPQMYRTQSIYLGVNMKISEVRKGEEYIQKLKFWYPLPSGFTYVETFGIKQGEEFVEMVDGEDKLINEEFEKEFVQKLQESDYCPAVFTIMEPELSLEGSDYNLESPGILSTSNSQSVYYWSDSELYFINVDLERNSIISSWKAIVTNIGYIGDFQTDLEFESKEEIVERYMNELDNLENLNRLGD